MKKRWAAFLTAAVLAAVLFPARSWAVELPVEAQAALLMEKTTGQVLYAKNEHEQLEPASVTKVMTSCWRWRRSTRGVSAMTTP